MPFDAADASCRRHNQQWDQAAWNEVRFCLAIPSLHILFRSAFTHAETVDFRQNSTCIAFVERDHLLSSSRGSLCKLQQPQA